jgi:hypothetical protein
MLIQPFPGMSRWLLMSFVVVACSLTGCVLPVPHLRVHVEGIEGKVIDARTRSPIDGARVTDLCSGSLLATTDRAGEFEVKAKRGWHGAYFYGPISYSLLPHFDMAYPAPAIRVAAEGYREWTTPEVWSGVDETRVMVPLTLENP